MKAFDRPDHRNVIVWSKSNDRENYSGNGSGVMEFEGTVS